MEITNSRGEIRKNELMSKHTSFAIGGPADILAYPVDRDDLATLLREIKQQGAHYFIIGGGTNLLVRDGGFRGVMISLKRMNAIRLESEYRSIGGSYAVVHAEQALLALPKQILFILPLYQIGEPMEFRLCWHTCWGNRTFFRIP